MAHSLKSIGDSVWRCSSGWAGPKIVILGGVHGNELVGVEIVRRLVKNLTGTERIPSKGSLVLALGNLKAIELNKRFVVSDLNRCFNVDDIDKPLTESSTYEEIRSRQLTDHVATANVLIDIHATNKPSQAFVRIGGFDKLNDGHLEILNELIGCHTLLLDPRNLIGMGRPVCSDELASAKGNVGICYETGFAGDLDCLPRVWDSVAVILEKKLGLDASLTTESKPVVLQQNVGGVKNVYELTSVFVLGPDGFRWNPPYGAYNFQKVPARDPVGFLGDTPIVHESDSYVIFPKVPDLWFPNKPLGWIAKEISMDKDGTIVR
eukprot:CFRG4050T1